MGRTLDDVMKSLPAERQARIIQRGDELIAQHLSLQQLRKSQDLTQEGMATALAMKQASVSKLEKRGDMLISTLRNYIEAMGGTLDLVARLPGQAPVLIEGIADLQHERG